ncbi:MAG: ChbG/HpnK family deacetylase [Alphaproteobacteria bacterium]|nr:ChbG/HpnK family deacetylase [Alphaproteobacteria bacterium]
MARLIVTADDLGIHPDISHGIVKAHEQGILTTATLLATTTDHWGPVLEQTRNAGLPVGIHLSLTLGRSIRPPKDIPDLVDAGGQLRMTAPQLLMRHQPSISEQIRAELDAQISFALDCGVRPTHLDSHQHVHMHPVIFPIVEDLAAKHGIRAVRIVREPLFWFELRHGVLANLRRNNALKVAALHRSARGIIPRLACNDRFFGVMYSGNLDKASFACFLRAIARSDETWEVGLHPGFPAPPAPMHYPLAGVNRFISSPWRQMELDLLLDPETRALVAEYGIKLISFAELAA